jgi:DNA-binding NtrC family response regulator
MKTNRHRPEAVQCGEAGTESVDRSPIIGGLIGESDLMQEVRRDIEIAATLDMSVLIVGEPGTGKELVARGIHDASSRRGRPFEAVNCARIDSDLIERDLFGYEKGAFARASARKLGRFHRANGGTLFLDEISVLTRQSQATLSRILQEREFKRVGVAEAITVGVRLVTATNCDLLREVEEGRFRRGLYDLLHGYLIRTPSLREHPADIPILIHHYFPFVELQEEALEMLCRFSWPGNVRELIAMVERLAAKAGKDRIVTADLARCEIDAEQEPALAPGNTECFPGLRDGESLTDWVCRGVLAAYERERARVGSHSAAARRLGMHRNTLTDWLAWARRHGAKSTTTPNR